MKTVFNACSSSFFSRLNDYKVIEVSIVESPAEKEDKDEDENDEETTQTQKTVDTLQWAFNMNAIALGKQRKWNKVLMRNENKIKLKWIGLLFSVVIDIVWMGDENKTERKK